MKRIDKKWLCVSFLAGLIILYVCGSNVWAAEDSGGWRTTYDLVLKWINFFILAFVVFKYGRTPLMNFLKGQKEKWAQEIKDLEMNKEDAVAKIRQTEKLIEESDVRLAELKDRIVQQGEKRKQEIIDLAEHHSRIMFEDARHRVEAHIAESKNAFRAEMVDAAIDLAIQRLPHEITKDDNQRFLDEYLTHAPGK
jgi:F-type H+-transporting ATPase subunit b